MSAHMAFRRQPVPQQVAQKNMAMTMPAPTRGLVLSENLAFMKPGGAMVCDNWVPTMRGVKLRGGCVRWCTLPETTPIISAFEYVSSNVERMFAANASKLYDVSGTPTLVKGGQGSGNYAAAQLANAAGDWLIAVNDAGDFPLRFNGLTWETLDAAYIPPGGMPSKITVNLTTYPGAKVVDGEHLVYVWKYRNRLFFIEESSMNVWYLPLNAVGGELHMIPLSGAATRGGELIFGATWSLDAGDGVDDKCILATTLGELLVFTGSDPASAASWRQEGRFQIDPPMGMNAHINLGGDLLIATTDGIVPISAAITKVAEALDLAKTTYNIRSLWRQEAAEKREWPWTMKRWDEYGGMFVTFPGGRPGFENCGVVNTGTGAWCRFTGWDATCWIRMRENLFFGTQDGKIMHADRSGTDDGQPYVATLIGNWGAMQSQPSEVVWHQARAVFIAQTGEPFLPQLSSCVNFVLDAPTPPDAGLDVDVFDVWGQGIWDDALWDQQALPAPAMRTTMWVSIGTTGYTHAPVVQATIAQHAKPTVELVSIDAVFERQGVNV